MTTELEKEIVILLESKVNPSVAMHGGNISFDKSPSEGLRVKISLPL